jgi:acyl-CoA synthetase (AMP-forming)/AMP-acid ligase II
VSAARAALLARGLRKGERVLVLGRKSVELAVALLAVPNAGGVVVAPYPGLSAPQLRHIVADAAPAIAVDLGSAADARAELDAVPVVLSFDELSGAARDGREPARPAPDDPAMIVYTSGSTGKPKGVVFSHENVRLGADSVARYYCLAPDDRVLCLLPFSFDAGFNQLTSALVAGCAVHLRDFVLPHHVAAVCGEHRITTLTGVPALWRRLTGVDWPDAARRSMRRWCNTGGHVPVELSERLCDLLPLAAPILMYGFTEAFRATYLPPPLYREKPASVGVPIPHAAIAIVRDDGSLCAPGEEGELVQFGPLVTLGYWNREDDTRRAFRPIGERTRRELLDPANRLFRVPREHLDRAAWSGDNLVVDDDGCAYFRSRRTGLIKSQGFRVSPGEVEEACVATGLVAEAVAFGVEHDGEEAVAVAARPASEAVTPDRLREALRRSLASYQVPATIDLRESLPMTPNGKYDVARLEREAAPEPSAAGA